MPRLNLCLLCAAVALALAVPGQVQATQIAQASTSSDAALQAEIVFWKSIESSTEAAEYQAYLETYPKGRFAALARTRLKRYGKKTDAGATAKTAAPTAEGKPVYVPKEKPGGTTASEQQQPRTYVARTRAHVYRKPTVRSAQSGEYFVEAESFQVTEVVKGKGGRWLKVITRSGKVGYVFARQAKPKGSTKRGSIFMNPDEEPTEDKN